MSVLETPRLTLRELTLADAPFILALLNEPSWLRYIGDRGVRTLADAENYLRNGPLASYAAHGFGLWLVVRKGDAVPVGLCGLLKRVTLADVDLGFAFREEFHGQGYGAESAAAVIELARSTLRLPRLVALVSPENTASLRLLEKLGLVHERRLRLTAEAPEVLLLAINF